MPRLFELAEMDKDVRESRFLTIGAVVRASQHEDPKVLLDLFKEKKSFDLDNLPGFMRPVKRKPPDG